MEDQLNIYDHIGIQSDPLMQKLKQLNRGQSVALDDLEITLNQSGLYEISTEETHDCCGNLKRCYDYVNNYLKSRMIST